MCPGPAEVDVAGKKGRGPVRLVEPVLGLSDVLLGLMETSEARPGAAPSTPAAAEHEPMLQLRMPDGRVKREPPLGGFWPRDDGLWRHHMSGLHGRTSVGRRLAAPVRS